MKQNGYLVALFAILILIGGMIGYYFAGSYASLLSSSISGLLLLIASMALLRNLKWGYYLALVLSATLALFFLNRFIHIWTWVPFFMTCVSVAVFTRLWVNKAEPKKV